MTTTVEPLNRRHPHRTRRATGSTEISQEKLVDRVRSLRDDAHQAGRPLPGRPALASTIGVSPYRIRRALDQIALEDRLIREQHSQPNSDADADTTDSETPPSKVDQAAPEVVIPQPRGPASRPATEAAGRPWPLVIIGLAAAISVWSGWVGLGQLAGFGMIQPLPGVWDDLRLNSAIVLPVSVEAYAAYALRCWLTSRPISRRARTFARWSAIISLVIGAAAQVAFHLMTAAGMSRAPWPVTVGVATVPVVVLGLATALASLIRTGGTTQPCSPGTTRPVANGRPEADRSSEAPTGANERRHNMPVRVTDPHRVN